MKYPTASSVIIVLVLASSFVGQESNPLPFDLTRMGEIEDNAGTQAGFRTSHSRTTHLGFKEYEAPDGEKVVIQNGRFRNADEARRYFDWILGEWAAQAVVQGDKIDRDGKTVGRRAEYLAKPGKSKARMWIVMWTDEESFHLINSPTLEYVIALERQCR